jgi:hypothetical protein
MNRLTACGLILFLSACGLTAPGHAETPLAERGALDFSQSITTEGLGEKTDFAKSVAARYGKGLSKADILADVKAQGFDCDAGETACTLTKMEDGCAHAWIVDFDTAGAASGRHVKRCMGALVDEE